MSATRGMETQMGRQKRKPHLKPGSGGAGGSAKKRKEKGKSQGPNPKGQRVMVVGPTGKVRFEWR